MQGCLQELYTGLQKWIIFHSPEYKIPLASIPPKTL